MSRKFLRVAKVGGSLFDFAELSTVLRCWLDEQPGVNVLLAGGGSFANGVRQVDQVFQLGESTAHRLAIESMRISAELLTALLPETQIVRSLDRIPVVLESASVVVLDPVHTLTSTDCQLPHSWDVTSDSIAAFVASELQAHELVLFKSTPLPANATRSQAATEGLVDRHFAQAAVSIQSVRWVNLRGKPVTERPL